MCMVLNVYYKVSAFVMVIYHSRIYICCNLLLLLIIEHIVFFACKAFRNENDVGDSAKYISGYLKYNGYLSIMAM